MSDIFEQVKDLVGKKFYFYGVHKWRSKHHNPGLPMEKEYLLFGIINGLEIVGAVDNGEHKEVKFYVSAPFIGSWRLLYLNCIYRDKVWRAVAELEDSPTGKIAGEIKIY